MYAASNPNMDDSERESIRAEGLDPNDLAVHGWSSSKERQVSCCSMSPIPVTRTMTAAWDRPRYELLDARGAVIDALAKLSQIRSFSTQDDSLQVDFQDWRFMAIAMTELVVIDADLSPPATGWKEQVQAVASVLGAAKARVRVDLQHLLPWADQQDPKAAQRRCSQFVSGMIESTDFAILLDGEDEKFQFQAEYGIVSREEIPDRISRRRGRSTGPRIRAALEEAEFAPVSTFVDSVWKIRRAVDIHQADCWKLIGDVDEHAAALVSRLQTRLTSGVEGATGDCA